MKTIALVTSGDLPVPAVKGGAVETLIDLLVKENEKQKKVNFIIVSCFNKKAEEQSKKNFTNAEFIYIQKDNFFEKKISLCSFAINKFAKVIFKNEIPTFSAYYRKAFSALKNMSVDFVVFEGGPRPSSFSCFKEKFVQDKLCIHLHGNWFPSRFVSNMFGRVISVSKFIEKEYLSTNENKTVKAVTVYNTVDELLFRKQIAHDERVHIRNTFGFSEQDFVVIYCGRICADKGVLELMNAILNCNSAIKLLIIGSPHYAEKDKTEYLQKVVDLTKKSNGRIKFTGFINNNEVYKYYKSSDIQCVPSMWEEPGGLVNIEGMMSGLPLVVTDSGGIPEYVTEKCALIVNRNESIVENLRASIERLFNDDELMKNMAEESLKRSYIFSVKKFYRSYLECFE